jgi:glycosyltransferase involved in cell wall biosynthesis
VSRIGRAPAPPKAADTTTKRNRLANGAAGSNGRVDTIDLQASSRVALAEDQVTVDGKFFAAGGERFEFRGVTYGTFAPREDGARFPGRTRIGRDFASMREVGFSVVRTYTVPPDDVLEAARDHGLRVLADVFYPDWRYLLGGSRRQQRAVSRQAAQQVRAAARRLAGCEQVLGLSLGNEVPADVVRWYGTDLVANTLRELSEIVREEDPAQLVTYGNYPTAEYLPLDTLDFLMFNVFLERRDDFRRYLTRLHHLAGDRPLVLGELGLSGDPGPEGERRQAEVLDWQLETAIERGVAGTCVFSWTDEWWVGDAPVSGWRFGVTRADRSPRPALEVATRWNQRTVRDLGIEWPPISVIICAYNAGATLDECLRKTCVLDYPSLEVIVVDDGSADETAEIARRYPVRLLSLEHGGLGVARNEGFLAATGELIAYLDADAYPSPEWPYYLALGFDAPDVGGVGGPNLPPPGGSPGAEVVARAPGGPVHVLISDDRAEHIPGCNMAFWKLVLSEVGGFDPVYTAAGDDVDFCWKVLDRSWKVGFHPAAAVWHHRRPGLRTYLRQQQTYGRAEALVEARHPERFTAAGTARWRGRIYNSLTPVLARQRIYRGAYGAAAYQSVYHGGGHFLDLLHQIGVPIATALLLAAPLALISPWLAVPALAALLFLLSLAGLDVYRADPPRRHGRRGRPAFRAKVAAHHLLQPLVRHWARSRSRDVALRGLRMRVTFPAPVRKLRGGVVVVPEDRPRAELAAALVDALRSARIRAMHPSGWEDCDARLLLSACVYGELQTSAHPEGFVQVRIRPRLRRRYVGGGLIAGVAGATIAPVLALVVVLPVISLVRGVMRARRLPARLLTEPS